MFGRLVSQNQILKSFQMTPIFSRSRNAGHDSDQGLNVFEIFFKPIKYKKNHFLKKTF